MQQVEEDDNDSEGRRRVAQEAQVDMRQVPGTRVTRVGATW